MHRRPMVVKIQVSRIATRAANHPTSKNTRTQVPVARTEHFNSLAWKANFKLEVCLCLHQQSCWCRPGRPLRLSRRYPVRFETYMPRLPRYARPWAGEPKAEAVWTWRLELLYCCRAILSVTHVPSLPDPVWNTCAHTGSAECYPSTLAVFCSLFLFFILECLLPVIIVPSF